MDETQNTTANKTITPRNKQYKENAHRMGWHVHCDGEYIGYDNSNALDEIAQDYCVYTGKNDGFRLTYIGGNILVFER